MHLGWLTLSDGAVVIDRKWNARGFGAKFSVAEWPNDALEALNETASETRPLDISSMGMRHKSMLAQVKLDDTAIGIVISQDGNVSAMATINGTVTVWRNLLLRRFQFTDEIRASKIRQSTSPTPNSSA